IHLGAIFGTIMAGNVWMRIWPNQRKIIAATKAGTAPDAAIVSVAGLRSKHNTYMSVPLVFAMVSNHFPTIYGMDGSWILLAVLVLVGWGVTKLLYQKAASPAPAQYLVARQSFNPAIERDGLAKRGRRRYVARRHDSQRLPRTRFSPPAGGVRQDAKPAFGVAGIHRSLLHRARPSPRARAGGRRSRG